MAPNMILHREKRCIKGHPFDEVNTYVDPKIWNSWEAKLSEAS